MHLRKAGERPQQQESPRKWRYDNDSHPGTRNLYRILTHRSFLLEEARNRNATSAGSSENRVKRRTALCVDAGGRVPRSGKSSLSPGTHLGAQRIPEPGARRDRRFCVEADWQDRERVVAAARNVGSPGTKDLERDPRRQEGGHGVADRRQRDGDQRGVGEEPRVGREGSLRRRVDGDGAVSGREDELSQPARRTTCALVDRRSGWPHPGKVWDADARTGAGRRRSDGRPDGANARCRLRKNREGILPRVKICGLRPQWRPSPERMAGKGAGNLKAPEPEN